MTGKTISPLRQRMIEVMSVRNFDPHTQSCYIRAVKKLAAFLGRSPDQASGEDLRRFQIHLRQTGVPAPTINATVTALRFFYRTTLDKPEIVRHLTVVPKALRLPVVLSHDEVTRLLEATSKVKYKAALGSRGRCGSCPGSERQHGSADRSSQAGDREAAAYALWRPLGAQVPASGTDGAAA